MRLAVLGSGSGGNAVVVESAGRRLLIDAGFAWRELERRLATIGCASRDLDALLLTHEHKDHCYGAAALLNQTTMSVYATRGTFEGAALPPKLVKRAGFLRSGEYREISGFRIEPFAVPHDAREPIGMVVQDEAGCRIGLVADLGTRSQLAWGRLRDLDLLILETNHDLQMLRHGPYPWALKQRVAGRHGHLSNRDAADGLADLVSDRLRTVVLYHLSKTNNSPALAANEIATELDRLGSKAGWVLTRQDAPTDWLAVDAA